jgi:hypothetical protein
MPVQTTSDPTGKTNTNTNPLYTGEVRPTGSAGAASVDALAWLPPTGAGSGGTVYAGSTQAESADRGSAPSARLINKDEADRLYEENIEEEYAKREGGA